MSSCISSAAVSGSAVYSGKQQRRAPSVALAGQMPHHARAVLLSTRPKGSQVSLSSNFVAGRPHARRTACKAKVSMAGDGLKRIIISGAPASGKGTQCEKIKEKFGLAHISAGDLLRAEVAAGTEAGKRAEGFMKAGELVPDEVVITMVKNRLAEDDAQTKGWLLDGYPRSASQAAALKEAGIEPDIFLLLEVPDDILIERVVGRRMDPETGKIYHVKYFPPPPEIEDRLTQRSDDNEEAAKNRLATHARNVNAVVDNYKHIMVTVDGNRDKEAVFSDIIEAL
uniref:adenylate kinase n=1 Tax=Tetraselmis chuii TaxID=63592 RepID=A0A7S1T984_9CHLO|mmetsp:Transcript_8888/g.15995  ORF Transcript_8888/g.15995 Transcript_8888/m.15995 type:complete len:283 (+) Transcript_8888:135-983(+)